MAKGVVNPDWKRPDYEGRYPSVIDWARLAAFIDGEGCILINRRSASRGNNNGEQFYLRIMVANTDVRLMEWIKAVFGGTYINSDPNKYKRVPVAHYKMAYHWGCSASRAGWILFNCRQFFIIKPEQADLAIQLQETMRYSGLGRAKTMPPEVAAKRREIKNRMLLLKADNKHPQCVEAAQKELSVN